MLELIEARKNAEKSAVAALVAAETERKEAEERAAAARIRTESEAARTRAIAEADAEAETVIADAAELNAATAHRFLLTLEELGAVHRTGDHRFRLGVAVANLARGVEHGDLIGDLCRPHVRALVDTFRESASAAVLREGGIEYVAKAAAPRSSQIEFSSDRALPLHCSAVGKVLLASRPALEREEVLAGLDLVAHTSHTITGLVELRRELARVDRQGFGVDDQETEEGLRCIAVPIRGDDRAVVAALAISGPVSRMTDARMSDYGTELMRRAAQVSGALYTESKVLPDRARPRADYPHVKVVGDFVFVSGISARRPDETFVGARVTRSGEVELDIREQSRATIENVREIIRSVGGTLSDVVEIDAFLVSMDDYEGFNEIYARYFDASGPARTTVAVRALPHPHQILTLKAVARVTHGRS